MIVISPPCETCVFWESAGIALPSDRLQVPMPALATAHSLSRNDGDVWVDKAVTQADSFPLTDADTSARYCDTLQHGVSDPPAFTGLQPRAIQLSNTPDRPRR